MPEPIQASNRLTQLTSKNIKISAININSITAPNRLQELQNFVDANDVHQFSKAEQEKVAVWPYTSKTLPFSQITDLESDAFETLYVGENQSTKKLHYLYALGTSHLIPQLCRKLLASRRCIQALTRHLVWEKIEEHDWNSRPYSAH